MTISIKHKFVNPKSDTGDATVSRASNWNDEHDITLAQNRVLGRVSAANGPVEELTGEQIRTVSDVAQAGVLVGINTRTASYTLVASDRGKIVEMNVASANTVTVPNETGIGGVNYPIGTQIKITQFGTGQTTLLPAAGVTARSVTGGLSTSTRYGALILYKRASNDWFVIDQTSAYLDGRVDTLETIAGGIANVGTVAADIANVNTVAGSIANVNIAAANIVPIQNASGNAAAAAASASSAQTSATNAAASASTAVTAKNGAVTAAEASGSIYGYYDTKTLADAALSGAPTNAVISVFADESRNGLSTRYRKEGGVWVFKEYFAPRTIIDVVGRPQVDPNMNGIRSAGLKLRKAVADVRAGTRQSFRIMAIGDSLSTYTWTTAHMQMQRVLEGYLRSTPVYAYGNILNYGLSSNYGAVTTSLNGSYSTSVARDKYDYTKSWTGSFIEHGAGQVTVFSIGNNDIYADRLLIPIIKESGAGSVKIEIAQETNPPAVASASWRNPTAGEIVSAHSLTAGELIVSANGSFGLDMVILSVALNLWSVKITQVSGSTVRTLPNVMNEVRDAPAVNTYRLSTASNNFTSETSTAQPVMAGMIAAYDPDVIIVSSDDNRAAYENYLPKLESALTASGLSFKPLVLLECNPYLSNGPGLDDAAMADRTAYCHQFAASRVGWDVIDGLALSGGLSEAQRAGWGGDGIHFNGELSWQMTRNWAISRGYMPWMTERAGGDASFADIVKSANPRLVTAAVIQAALGMPSMQDTGSATWSSLLAGTGAYSRAASGYLQLSSGATASSTVVAYINDALPLWGWDQGQRSADLPGGFSCQARLTVRTTNGVARIMWAGDRSYSGVYKGDLTASGVGFVIRDNIVKGMCWDGAAVVESSSSFAASASGSGRGFDLQLILTPSVLPNGNPSTSYGTCEWFVNGVSLGKAQYYQVVSLQSLRAELTNGADAANYVVQVSPPKVVTVR